MTNWPVMFPIPMVLDIKCCKMQIFFCEKIFENQSELHGDRKPIKVSSRYLNTIKNLSNTQPNIIQHTAWALSPSISSETEFSLHCLPRNTYQPQESIYLDILHISLNAYLHVLRKPLQYPNKYHTAHSLCCFLLHTHYTHSSFQHPTLKH